MPMLRTITVEIPQEILADESSTVKLPDGTEAAVFNRTGSAFPAGKRALVVWGQRGPDAEFEWLLLAEIA
jgi:hypothetical protein